MPKISRRLSPLAAAILTIAAISPASAGSPYGEPQRDRTARDARLAASGVINVPDLQGCVKWCLDDINPCDPIIFKRGDGRCQEP